MSATITPGVRGEGGYIRLSLDLLVNDAELTKLARLLDEMGIHDISDALADKDES